MQRLWAHVLSGLAYAARAPCWRARISTGVCPANAKLGAVAVLSRGSDPGQGHVGFVVGAAKDQLFLLGGNQKDAVTVQSFPMGRLLGLRWPSTAEGGRQDDDLFEAALAHVLAMEGGWTAVGFGLLTVAIPSSAAWVRISGVP